METYFFLDGSNGWTTFPDNKKAAFGTGNDLQIYHDGSNSYLRNTNGNLYIKNELDDGDIIFQSDDGSGGVETYFFLDGSNSHTNFQLNARWVDDAQAQFGNSGDLLVYHDGSNSYIKDGGTGSLYTLTNAYRLTNSAGNENMIWAEENSFVKLYHNNSAKLETTSTGVEVTGNIAVSGTVDGRDIATDGTKLDTVATNADVTPSWVPSSDPGYLTSLPSHNHDDRYYTETESDARYAALSHNHAASSIVTGTLADGRISESSVTQHEAALTITEGQLPDDMPSDKVKQICTSHHNFFMNSSSTSADFFVPFNNLNESSNPTNAQYYNRMVAPYDGRIVKVVLHTTAAIGTACQALFWVATSAGVFAPSAAETVTGINLNTANTSATATFSTTSTAEFNEGDVLGVSIIKSSSATANMQVTVVWEYTL